MRNRFFVREGLAPAIVVALDDDERHHARVLRVRTGEEVELFDGRGNNYFATFESPDAIRVLRKAPNRESPAVINLAMSIIQLEKFELVLQKGTELGAYTFIPLFTDRGEVRAERLRGKGQRWQKIVFEAVKQSGRSRIPVVEEPAKFDHVIARQGTNIVFDADTEPATQQPSNPATLFIGPEGGWSERELILARDHGASFEQLGPRRLRAETAAIAAVVRFL